MSPPTDREEILSRFRAQINKGVPIVGAGAGRLFPSLVPSYLGLILMML
jgi:predicted TIM-barrel enzyme